MSAAPLGLGRTIGYAIGDFGFNLFFTFANLFLLYYYTDVLGIPAAAAGGVIMVALVIEGALDPAMGVLANRTRSRFGRYRPWLLFGAGPLCLSFVAMFLPLGLSGGALLAYTLATHLMFRLLYTVVGIPYAALSAQMTSDSRERSTLAGVRMLFAIACGLTLATATLPLVAALGGGREGFFRVSVGYAAAAFVILMICYASTREDPAATYSHPTLREAWRGIRDNRPFQLVMWAMVLASIGSTTAQKTLVYYMKYVVGSEASVTPALALSTLVAGIALPFWMFMTRRIGKRLVWVAGATIATLQGLTFFILAPTAGALLWIVIGAGGFATAAIVLTFWSTVPDTVEFGEWRSGVRTEGAIYGVVTLAQKVALGIGVGLLGVLLQAIGYRPNEVQSPDTVFGIRVLVALGPAILASCGGLLMWFYPIDWRLHGRLTKALGWRRRSVLARDAAPA
jgi:GPH family glycoside/pentoside/hexuronide:cation symporter